VIKLGEGEAPGDKYDLDEMLNEGGLWAGQLATNWTTSGFLLLVVKMESCPPHSQL